MRAEYPIFPLIFMILLVSSITTTLVLIFSISEEIGIAHGGVRSAALVLLYEKADIANRYLETTVRISARDAVAEEELFRRYPCGTVGSFASYDESCASSFDEDAFASSIAAEVATRTNAQLATHPRALLPEVVVENRGPILFVAQSSEDAIFMLDDLDWVQDQVEESFDPVDAPVYAAPLAATTNVEPILEPAIERREAFEQDSFDTLVEEALAADRAYCGSGADIDPFAPIVAAQRAADLVNGCPESDDACSCGELETPDMSDAPLAGSSIVFADSIIVSNGVYNKTFGSLNPLAESEAVLDGSDYTIIMESNETRIVSSDDVPIDTLRCSTKDPKINVFSTVPFLFETDDIGRGDSTVKSSVIFDEHESKVALYDYSVDYRFWSYSLAIDPPSSIGDRIVQQGGLNLVIATHSDPDGSSFRIATSGLSGFGRLVDTELESEGLYPATEARLEWIFDEMGFENIEQASNTCRARIDEVSILSDSYVTQDIGSWAEAIFFEEIVASGAPYVFISIPSSFVDECLDSRTLDFFDIEPGPDDNAQEVQERAFRGVVNAAVTFAQAPPTARLVCLEDPVFQVTHHPFLGYNSFEINPYVVVPDSSNNTWPLEEIWRFTQCWGPPEQAWTDAPYTFHRGIDLQPTGARVDRYTVWDRFPEVPVVAVTNGTIVYSTECPYSPYLPLGTLSDADLMDAAEEHCTGRYETNSGGGFGEHLIIDHGSFYAIYAHLAPGSVWTTLGATHGIVQPVAGSNEKRFVSKEVEAGQPIGYVGSTGTSIGAHLHFEVYTEARDTSTYLPLRPAVYAPPATDFSQFNPLCILPQTIETDAGEVLDIGDTMPLGADFNPEDPVSSPAGDAVTSASSTFERPKTLSDMCSYNYLMAYFNENSNATNYGVCPNI